MSAKNMIHWGSILAKRLELGITEHKVQKMRISEMVMSDLSKLQSRVYCCEFGGKHNPKALILEFSGEYGWGSSGNTDALYMEAIKTAWLKICHVNAIVFDLRQMKYEWGNSVWNVLACDGLTDDEENNEDSEEPRMVFPKAIVISDLCRKGFESCKGMVPPAFDNLESALQFVESPARTYLEKWFEWIDSPRFEDSGADN